MSKFGAPNGAGFWTTGLTGNGWDAGLTGITFGKLICGTNEGRGGRAGTSVSTRAVTSGLTGSEGFTGITFGKLICGKNEGIGGSSDMSGFTGKALFSVLSGKGCAAGFTGTTLGKLICGRNEGTGGNSGTTGWTLGATLGFTGKDLVGITFGKFIWGTKDGSDGNWAGCTGADGLTDALGALLGRFNLTSKFGLS